MRILAFAYGCEPNQGSEPGAGWAWARMLSGVGETWVLTRANNRGALDPALDRIPEGDRIHFVYVDLPGWARFWKRGPRGARLYYLMWQVAALRKARLLEQEVGFDLIWHLTMSTAWLGSLAPLVGRPFAWGPIGGGVATAWSLVPALGVAGAVAEVARALAQAGGRYLNPLARLAWRRAEVILVQNPETRAWLPRRHREKAHVFHHVALEDPPAPARRDVPGGTCTALFVGRLLPWKGAALAIRALSQQPDWSLLVCGKGPDEARLRRLARRHHVSGRVEFLGRVPRDEVARLMREDATAFIFPSLHDEAGWVIAEALAAGLPVICLRRGGPPLLAGPRANAVSPFGGSRAVVARLAAALEQVSVSPSGDGEAGHLMLEHRSRDLSALLQPYLARLDPAPAATAGRAVDRAEGG